MKKILEIVAFILVTQYLSAQNFEVGAEYGYGHASIDSYISFKDLFSENELNNLNFGLSASSNPHKSVLFVNSGLYFHRIYDQENSLNFFKLPIGIDLALGKRLKFFFGGGGYLDCLFLMTGKYSQEPPNKRNIQIGLYFDLGLRYLIVHDWCIYLKTLMEFDQSIIYSYDPGEEYYIYDYGIVIGFRYLITLKNEKNSCQEL